MKTPKEIDAEVAAYTRAVGKQARDALLFFFVGLPAIVAFIMFSLFYGLTFLVPACLILAAVLWLRKKLKERDS